MDEVTHVDPRRLSPVIAGETQLAVSLEGIKDLLSRRLWVSYDVSSNINHGHRPQLKRTRVESLEEQKDSRLQLQHRCWTPEKPGLVLTVILYARASEPSPGCCCPLLVITGLGACLAEQAVGSQGTGFLALPWKLP